MKPEFDFAEYVLSQFGRNISKNQGIEQLIARYQTLAIMYLNFFFLGVLVTWKVFDLFFGPLPGNEVMIALPPLQITSIILMRKGRKDIAAFLVLLAIHTGNFLAGNVCNVILGAAYLVLLLPGLAFFLTSNKKMHFLNLAFCVAQNIGHMRRIYNMFKVTFTEDQHFQIFSLILVSVMYIPLSYCLFAFQKYVETHLWQVAQLNYERAERITKEFVEAVESKDKVVSSFSHEIRNPLNSLNGSIDYLLKTVVDPSQKKVLKNARLSGEVLLNLVNNILDAAKLKSEKLEIACVEASPSDVVKKVLTINSEIVQQKKIVAKAYLHKQSPQLMYIDSSRLLQVIMNLFSNATKFTKEKGKIELFMQWFKQDTSKEQLLSPFNVTHSSSHSRMASEDNSIVDPPINDFNGRGSVWEFEEFEQSKLIRHSRNISVLENNQKPHFIEDVKLHSEWITKSFNIIDCSSPYALINSNKRLQSEANHSSRGFLKVQVSDSGCGIAPENISKLFNMFSQVEAGSGGTGLGLWISKQLCQKMGGDIAIYSKVNMGTTVVFYIAVDNNGLSSNILANVNSNAIEKLRALVVDDYSYNRDVHKLILEREGVEVSLACDGKEAYEKYISQPEGYFSFIMMDIQMPVMDGIESAQEMRKFEEKYERKQIEIYFVSGNYYSQTEAFSANGSAVGMKNMQFLRKPIDVEMIKKISDKYSSLLKKSSS